MEHLVGLLLLGGVCGELGWVRFLVCFLYKTNPDPRKTICCGKIVAQMPLLTSFFLGWVALGLGS